MNAEQIASRAKKLRELQESLGYTFHDGEYLERALCHSSYSHENGLGESNERLEFLGDAVLELAISRLLFDFYDKNDEGHLTKERAKLVCKRSLVKIARFLKFESLIMCGKSVRQSSKMPDSICADALEAILGSVYLDGGFEEALRVVSRLFVFCGEGEIKPKSDDPKSRLQTVMQSQKNKMPQYKTISVEGPDHAPIFKVKVTVGDREWSGEGSSKKSAESNAAEKALREVPPDAEKEAEISTSLFTRLINMLKR